jgi:hypothetical protein
MRLFDKLKQATNFITGGGATLTAVPEKQEFSMSAPVKVKVAAQVKDAPLTATAVYLEIRAREVVSLKVNINGKKEDIREEQTMFTHKVQTAITTPLEASKSYEWELEVTLPVNAQPTYIGSMTRHVWEVSGGLDVKGNDPDSGWIEIKVK